MAVKTRATIKAEAASFITDNSSKDVSGGDVRTRIEDLADSCWNVNDYGVVVISESGVMSVFTPSADTDAARGDALEAAIAAHVEGDTIRIGSGTYEVSYTLVLKAGVTLTGAGRFATTVKQVWLASAIGNPSFKAHSLIINEGFNTEGSYDGAGNIEIRDLTIFCRSSGIGLGHCGNVRIHNVHCAQMTEATENGHFFDICGVKNFLAEGLSFTGVSYGFGVYQVDSAEVNSALQALHTDSSTELTVFVDDTPCQNIRFIGCQSEITGTATDNSVHYAIHRNNHNGILISGCQMTGGRFALDSDDDFSGISNVTMEGCQFVSTDATALKPPVRLRSADTDGGAGTVRMHSVAIVGCVFEYGGSYGLFFRRVDGLTISGNVLRSTDSNAAYGALFYGCNGTVTGNTVVSTNSPAISGSAAFFTDESPSDATSNQIVFSGNHLVNWDRGVNNVDAAADLILAPNVYVGVNVEVYSAGGNPEQVFKTPGKWTSSVTTPSTTEYPADGNWGIHKDTVAGDLYLAANDGGVIKSVALT